MSCFEYKSDSSNGIASASSTTTAFISAIVSALDNSPASISSVSDSASTEVNSFTFVS